MNRGNEHRTTLAKLISARTRLIRSIIAISLLMCPVFSLAQSSQYGRFIGAVRTEWIDDGRHMQLLGDFSYIDPMGKRWAVPQGTKIDGASIPRAFWTVIGGPFEGPYRNASVVHDYHCDSKLERWQDVHRMFYYGMLAAGTDELKAKIMYFAVLVGGPRWKVVKYSNHPPRLVPKKGDIDYEKLTEWSGAVTEAEATAFIEKIELEQPSVEQIEVLANEAFSGAEPPARIRIDRR